MSKPSSSPVIVPMGPELTMPALLWSTEGNEALLECDHNKSPPTIKFLTIKFLTSIHLEVSPAPCRILTYDYCHLPSGSV